MAPQPATKLKWNGNHIFASEVLLNKPQWGCLIAGVIAGWSMTETQLGRLFAALIGAKQPITLSMYAAVRSDDVKQELLRVAACEVLPKRYAQLFHAGLAVVNQAAKVRHSFAHHVWGASADPGLEAFLLVEPKHFWDLHANRIKFNLAGKGTLADAPQIAREHIMVYQLRDLDEARERMEQAFSIARGLDALVRAETSRRRLIYQTLSKRVDIQAALKRVKKNWPQPRPKRHARPRGGPPPLLS
jgi:hypothetical protein